ncbi:branched-chain amino acid aminotransferase [Rhodoferax sp. GW822-FHT02A01]|uniref:branched-chain amino acid aminotransferase n=1 Tax=Rhodoferax sp. GW822-FHT02A01 TaxID=3141537 RepID=UPI00315D4703
MTTCSSPRFRVERHLCPVGEDERRALLRAPGFGQVFTDHMATIGYSEDRGWHDATIGPRQALCLDPAALVCHYAQEIYEGMKAYRLDGGGTELFRPDANAQRFRRSAARLAMPLLPEVLFTESVRALVRVENAWIPSTQGHALYLRPFMVAIESARGVRASTDYLYCVVASPVRVYFSRRVVAVTLWVSDKFTRAAPGGTGDVKCGGNYAAGLSAQAEAIREQCDQAIFLDAVERRWVEELGGMNVFFVFADGSIQTPPLNGTILAGITRESLIALADDIGLIVREESYSIDQWQDDAKSGRLQESFACGTAAVVAPIGEVRGRKHRFTIGDGDGDGDGDGGPDPITERLKYTLTDIQLGRAADTHGWLDRLS